VRWLILFVSFLSCEVLFGQPASRRLPITALTFSPDGNTLTASGPGSVVGYSVKDGSRQWALPCVLPRVSSISFGREGHFLAIAGGVPGAVGGVQLTQWGANTILFQATNRSDLVNSVSFSPDSQYMAAAGSDGNVELFKIGERGRSVAMQSMAGHAGPVLAVAFSPDGRLAVSTSADRSVKVWEIPTGKLLRSFSHHTAIVHCLAFRPLGSEFGGEARPAFCATGSDDHTVRVWQPEIGRMVRIVRHHQGPIFALVYSRDGAQLFSAGKEGIVRVIDSESDAILRQWQAHDDWIYALAISPDGRTLATGDWSGEIKVWEAATGRLLTPSKPSAH